MAVSPDRCIHRCIDRADFFVAVVGANWPHWAAIVDCVIMETFGVGAFAPENMKTGAIYEQDPSMVAKRKIFAELKTEHERLQDYAIISLATFLQKQQLRKYVPAMVVNLMDEADEHDDEADRTATSSGEGESSSTGNPTPD